MSLLLERTVSVLAFVLLLPLFAVSSQAQPVRSVLVLGELGSHLVLTHLLTTSRLLDRSAPREPSLLVELTKRFVDLLFV